jgi:hypothetical protein
MAQIPKLLRDLILKMTDNPSKARLLLTESDGPGRVTVDLEAFINFDGGISDALGKLVDRWLPMAAPHSRELTIGHDRLWKSRTEGTSGT